LPSPAAYTDIPFLVTLAQQHAIDAVHPGYGFLSESADFAAAMTAVGIQVMGPGSEILKRTGDKIAAKILAQECGVPVLEGLDEATDDVNVVRSFVDRVGLPVMVKAVDGGGGRGIRLVRKPGEVEGCVRAAVRASASGKVFVEKAVLGGWRHVEVQVVGDGREVRGLWERECSLQRRWQKVVEFAPVGNGGDRRVVGQVIRAAVRMAEKVGFCGDGGCCFC
jgi:pyruvate carboxylase